jgi:phosphosulfolactate synthase
MFEFLSLPERPQKPRETGITMILDKGLSMRGAEDMLETGFNHSDYVKLGWATSVVVPNAADKVALYQNAGLPACAGGTLFELCFLQGRLNEFEMTMGKLGFEMLEVSDGTIPMKQEDKLNCIKQLSKNFKVVSEFGSKDSQYVTAPRFWVEGMQAELGAGAWKVIAEGRESGTSGLYRQTEEVRSGLVDEIVMDISPENIIWETPQKNQQVFMVERFGPNVNLGNIAPTDIVSLETIRLGLRGDTLLSIHDK